MDESERGRLAELIADVWKELLGIDDPPRDAHFFELGGHSVLMGRARSRISRLLGREVPLVVLFDHPTITSLAGHLSHEAAGLTDRPVRDRREELERLRQHRVRRR